MCYAEFDTLTGSRIASIDINSPVVRMAYSPTSGHAVVAILEVSFFINYLVMLFLLHNFRVHVILSYTIFFCLFCL